MMAEYQLEDYARHLVDHSENKAKALEKLDAEYEGIITNYERESLHRLYEDDMHWIRREYGQYVIIHSFIAHIEM